MFRNIRALQQGDILDDTLSLEEFMPSEEMVSKEKDTGDDVEDDDPEMFAQEDFQTLNELIEETNQLSQLMTLQEITAEYGATESLLQFALRSELLAGTSMESYSLESFDGDAALEGLISAVANKVKDWSTGALSRIRSVIGAGITKVGSFLNRVKAAAGRIGTKIKEGVTAHPYVTAAAAVTAVAAVTTITLMFTGHIPDGGAGEFINRQLDKAREAATKIKWPFGSIKEAANRNVAIVNSESGATVKPKGPTAWTAAKLKELVTMATTNGSKALSALKEFGTSVMTSIKSYASSTGSSVAKRLRSNDTIRAAVGAGIDAGRAVSGAAKTAGGAVAGAAKTAGGAVAGAAKSAGSAVAGAASSAGSSFAGGLFRSCRFVLTLFNGIVKSTFTMIIGLIKSLVGGGSDAGKGLGVTINPNNQLEGPASDKIARMGKA